MTIQISKNRNISLLILASIVAISASLITAPMVTVGVGAAHPQKPKTPKDPKCNNVKILLKVSKIPKGSKIVIAQATLDGKTVNKTQNVNGVKKVAIPLSFKKLNPCPAIGDSFAGSVNSTGFNGAITSLKKPNKVNVVLS
jgi:hypothetical protein